MNRYGRQAMRFWERWMPTRLAALPNREDYFAELGVQAEAEVTDLASQLAGKDLPMETYLQKAARLATARIQAEEIVMASLVWTGDPELPLAEAREEWEQTSASEENLIAWAERMQDSPDSMLSTEELRELADRWALPTAFLEELVATEPPREHMLRNQAALQEAATIRFLRELQ